MTTTVSQEAVEVTQADRDAVAEFHRQSFKTLFTTTDADIDAGINRSYELLCQAFARHRQQAERGEAWRPIETASRDEPILAALKVHHRNGDTWWERHVIVIDSETGTISDMDYHHGWEADDYQFWQPLPTPPEAAT